MGAKPTGACWHSDGFREDAVISLAGSISRGFAYPTLDPSPVSGLRDRDVFTIPVGESSICLYVSCCKRMLLGWLAIDANI